MVHVIMKDILKADFDTWLERASHISCVERLESIKECLWVCLKKHQGNLTAMLNVTMIQPTEEAELLI